MLKILGIFPSDITIIICEAVLLLGLLAILVFLLRRQKSQKELQGMVWRKTREQTLTGLLENDYASEELKKKADVNVPYEVKYKDALARNKDAVPIQVVAYSGLSIQKYIFNVADVFNIGSDAENELVLNDDRIQGRDVQLVRKENRLYLKRAHAASSVYLRRGKKSYEVGGSPIEICDADIVVLGGTSLEITYAN